MKGVELFRAFRRVVGRGETLAVAAVIALAGMAGGCSDPAPEPSDLPEERSAAAAQAQPWFQEAGAELGVVFHHRSGHETEYYLPEMMGGGVGLLDYDGDGWLDIFCVNSGSLDPAAAGPAGHKLFRNTGGGRFEDVTERAGVAGTSAYGMGCSCADYDGDGDTDIYVTAVGRNTLYRNNADGTFSDVAEEAGVGHEGWGTSSAFFDYDGDGGLDLFVANYINWSREKELKCFSRGGLPDYCSPLNYRAPAVDVLYHNDGGGRFTDVTESAGLTRAYGNGLGVVCADFNGDGLIDVFVANDAVPNQLWVNRGGGRFEDEAMIRGCAVNSYGVARAGMGVAAVDLDESGWLDLFVTHLVGEGNGLFLNDAGYFQDTVAPKGPAAPSFPFTGFGVGYYDFDQDGNLDLFVANGRVRYGVENLDPKDPYAEPNTLIRGLGGSQFEEVLPRGGTEPTLLATSRGAAFGDLDNDGDIDVVVINRDGPAHVFRNEAPRKGNWILFEVLNSRGTLAHNAILRLEAGGRTQLRHVLPNQSYCSSNDPRVHFGLGDAVRVERVTVRWPGGKEESFGPFEAGKIVRLREGGGPGGG